jgi:hypothetical protein
MAGEITTSLTALQAAIATATKLASGDLEIATPAQLAPVKVALTATFAAIDARLATIESLIDETTVAGLTGGVSATAQITTFVAQVGYVRESDALHNVRAYLSRINANIITISG